MNKLLNERYVAVEGLENALEMAKALIKNDYQVMVQLDDCDIYIVAYTENTTEFGNKFTPLSFEEIDAIEDMRASEDEDDGFWKEEYDKLLEEYDKLSCEHEDLLDNYNKLADEFDEYFDDEDEYDEDDFDNDKYDDEDYFDDDDDEDFDDEEDED